MAETTNEISSTPGGRPLSDDTAPKKRTSDKDILEEGRRRLKYVIDENENERKKQKDDLLFSTLDQWPSDIRNARENDPNGARPCLTIDQINQYIVQVVNDIRQNRASVKVRPQDDYADIETAEVFQGIIRQIEDQSVAQVAYITAADSAVRMGEGYYRFVTEYEDETSFNQVIRIKRIPDMFCCYLGPHMMPDGSDAEYGFIFEDIPEERFRRLYPKAKYQAADFTELGDYQPYWGSEKKIRVAEYFRFEYERATLCFLTDGSTVVKEPGKDYGSDVVEERETQIKKTKWVKMTGVEILEKADWAGKYIPIVKVTGKESWVDGRRVIWGLVRPAKDSLRMYNYWASTITEKIGLSPKTPYIGAKGQFEGVEDRWQNANKVNYPYLEYNPQSIDGLSVPPPQRQPPAPLEVAMIQQLQLIREDVQSSLGMFKAALGKEQPNQSGKAILALTRESDTGTYHFQDNTNLSIQHGGRILIDLVPKIYDTERIIKITGEDGKIAACKINPEQATACREIQDETTGKIQKIYNLNVGSYDVTITTGPSYNTKRMEAAALFTDLANTSKDPASAAVVRYLAIKNSDFNGAEMAADMLEKLLPPGIVKKEGQPEIPPEVIQQMQQMEQAGNELLQENQELKAGVEQDKMKIAAQHEAKMKELELERAIEAEKAQNEKIKREQEMALKRWEAEQEMALARWKAEQELEIERMKAQAQAQAALIAAEKQPAGKPN